MKNQFSMGIDRNIHGKNRMEKNRYKITDFLEKIKKIRYVADFSAFVLHAPGSTSGEENVVDLSAIN